MSIGNVNNYLPRQDTKGYVYPLIENNLVGIRLWNQLKTGHKKKLLFTKTKYIEPISDFTNLNQITKIDKGYINF